MNTCVTICRFDFLFLELTGCLTGWSQTCSLLQVYWNRAKVYIRLINAHDFSQEPITWIGYHVMKARSLKPPFLDPPAMAGVLVLTNHPALPREIARGWHTSTAMSKNKCGFYPLLTINTGQIPYTWDHLKPDTRLTQRTWDNVLIYHWG